MSPLSIHRLGHCGVSLSTECSQLAASVKVIVMRSHTHTHSHASSFGLPLCRKQCGRCKLFIALRLQYWSTHHQFAIKPHVPSSHTLILLFYRFHSPIFPFSFPCSYPETATVTVKPLNKGHFRDIESVLYSEVSFVSLHLSCLVPIRSFSHSLCFQFDLPKQRQLISVEAIQEVARECSFVRQYQISVKDSTNILEALE